MIHDFSQIFINYRFILNKSNTGYTLLVSVELMNAVIEMSTISINIPTLQINNNELHNLISFISKHEHLLREFGAIRIQLHADCQLALYKRAKKLHLCQTDEEIVKTNKNNLIYFVQTVDRIDESDGENSLVTDEYSFWSSLANSKNNRRLLSISYCANKSFFSEKTSRSLFDIHRLPKQSILNLAGKKIVNQFVPCVRRAHKSGAIFPLNCSQQRLFSINYHHEGGNHHWYIIPNDQRDSLKKVLNEANSSACLDHGQLFINPLLLDKNQIRYYRAIQHSNEFIVLSSGTLSQSFTENASWSESIDFALPSWIERDYANRSPSLCQCNIPFNTLSETIDPSLLKPKLTQRYFTSYINPKLLDSKGLLFSLHLPIEFHLNIFR